MAAAQCPPFDVHESNRENVMQFILDAVKQCQVQFGGKTQLATEKDSCIQCLLAQFENAFLHGLKRGKVWGAISSLSEPLRHVTGKVLSGIPDAEISFWPFIKEHMSPLEIQRYLAISSIQTDSGRCRSWLRSCLNETSLERNLISILADRNTIRQFYEDWALFLDEERSSTLPMMARGLGSILFALDIEGNQLNAPFKQLSLPRSNVALAPVEGKNKNDPLSVIPDKGARNGEPSISNMKKRKKKVKQALIEEIEVPEDEPLSEMYRKHKDTKRQPHLKELNGNAAPTPKKILNDNGEPSSVTRGVENPVKSHRRATSLESSEIVRQKQDRYGITSKNLTEFEVPSFGLKRMEAVVIDKSNSGIEDNVTGQSKNYDGRKTQEIDNRFEVEEVESKENADYTGILTKLANLSTSFKTSFSTGLFNREHEVKESIGKDQLNVQPVGEQDDFQILVDDESSVFDRTSKLEMKQELNEQSRNEEYVKPVNTLRSEISISGIDACCRSRLTSEDFDNMLLQGDTLTPNENDLKFDDVMKLKTPPPTPADNAVEEGINSASNMADVGLISEGLKSKLYQLENHELPEGDAHSSVAFPHAEGSLVGEVSEDNHVLQIMSKDIVKQDDGDGYSINSSTNSSAFEDSDPLQPVGFECDNLVMTYDKQSSQAANDTLQLLKNSAEVTFCQNGEKQGETASQFGNFSSQYTESRMVRSSFGSDLSKEELKQAILATVKRKDELDEKNRVLQLALGEERELSLSRKTEVDTLSEKLQELQQSSEKYTTELSRENEVLRNQLKKYVAAVQLLKRENKNVSKETNEAMSTLRGQIDVSEVVLPPQPKERTYSEMDSIYEDKLIQMAQLHGELMEFHEMLQRDLVKKEKIISKMKEELVVLRGPLPEEMNMRDEDDDTEVNHHRPLINIWIPSVFIKGKGSDAHHLYQIYVRIGDEEWNIYRRYSQFHKMHITCSKMFKDVEKLHFPPKKILGKKDLKFVEGRRKKLQEYIRKVINISLANETPLSESPSKDNLEKSLPFFSEEFSHDGKKKIENHKKKSKRHAVYTGL